MPPSLRQARAVESAPVVVVAMDCLPAWIMSAYGAGWVGQPEIAGLAARGIVFDRVIATSADPRRTLADILMPLGTLVPAAVVTDAETGPAGSRGMLAAADIRRVPMRADGRLAADPAMTNLGRLFAAAEATVRESASGAGSIAAAARRLLVVEATSLNVAWDAPEEYRQAYQAPDDPTPPAGGDVPSFVADADTDPDLLVGLRHVFAGQLALFDEALGRLLAVVGPAATILLVGLRGLGLGLHGRVGPGEMPPYGELVHLPAILVDAGGRMAGQRYGGLVTPADLGATLAALADVSTIAPVDPDGPASPGHHERTAEARSRAGLFDRWQTPDRDRVIVSGAAGTAIVTHGWHAVGGLARHAVGGLARHAVGGADTTSAAGRPPMPRLYAKPDDFFELCDVADRSPDVAGELGGLLEAVAAGRSADAWQTPLSVAATHGVT